jgi:hypothetical protein
MILKDMRESATVERHLPTSVVLGEASGCREDACPLGDVAKCVCHARLVSRIQQFVLGCAAFNNLTCTVLPSSRSRHLKRLPLNPLSFGVCIERPRKL